MSKIEREEDFYCSYCSFDQFHPDMNLYCWSCHLKLDPKHSGNCNWNAHDLLCWDCLDKYRG